MSPTGRVEVYNSFMDHLRTQIWWRKKILSKECIADIETCSISSNLSMIDDSFVKVHDKTNSMNDSKDEIGQLDKNEANKIDYVNWKEDGELQQIKCGICRS